MSISQAVSYTHLDVYKRQPYHFPEKLIPLMISRALADQSLPVYGKGENVRDWLYVEDHCAAIDLVMRLGREGEVLSLIHI